MSGANDFNHFKDRMQSFRASDEAREQFVSDILTKYQALAEKHADLESDYMSERDNRRKYQREAEERSAVVADYERRLDASSFVLALIDGDGAIFQDALLKAADGDGGSEAASSLHHAIHEHLAPLYANSGSWPIMVQVYLSLDKLAMKLASVGLLRSPSDLRTFAQRFSMNQHLFSIIDVGQGKERADHKMKEMLRTFSDNPTCQHIIFGGCHDAGYLLNFEPFKHNLGKASRITLLETTPMYSGFNALVNFKRARFDAVFRVEPLPENVRIGNGPILPAPQPTVQSLVRPAASNHSSSPSMNPRGSVASPAPSIASTPTAAPSEPSDDSSWAAVGRNGVPSASSFSIAPTAKKNTKKKYAYYNKAEQRLDEPFPPKDPAAIVALDARMKKLGKNLCNSWHLRGRCENGKFCHFQHEPKLPPAELNVLRHKARTLPCKNRYCEDIDCYLGHQCPQERDQGYCSFGEKCHFRFTHGMDRVKHVRYDKDGNKDYVR